MSATQTSSKRRNRSEDSQTIERGPLVPVTAGIVVALALAVALLRLYRIHELPPGIDQDEGAHGVDALRVLQGEHAVFFTGHGGREGMVVYAVAVATSLFGRTLLATHLPTAVASVFTVFAVFWLGRLLFDRDENGRPTPWRGLIIGGVGAGLLAVSLSQTMIGRAGVRANYLPLFLTLCLALLWSGWRERSLWRVGLSGVCAGLLPYTYIPARFVPFLFLFFGLSLLPSVVASHDAGERWESGSSPRLLTRFTVAVRPYLPMIGLFLGAAGLVAAPILVYFVLHPEQFFMRSDQVLIFSADRSQGDPLGAFFGNIWRHLLAFGSRGDWSERHNASGRPMLTAWELVLFLFGAGTALWRRRRPAHRLLLLWLVVLFVPAVLAIEAVDSASFLRMIGIVPAVYLLIGVGLWEACRLFNAQARALPKRAALLYGKQAKSAAIALGVAICAVIAVQGANTYRIYFRELAAGSRYFKAFHGEWIGVARTLSAMPAETGSVFLLPYKPHENFGFRYLYQGATPALFVDAGALDLPLVIESELKEMEDVTAVKVLDWEGSLGWLARNSYVYGILGKYGHYQGSSAYPNFTIHRYTDVDLESRWTLYEYLEPRDVRFDGGIELRGVALGLGSKQLPSQQTLVLEEDRSLWVALQWLTHADLDVDYAVSLRLHSPGGASVYQRDQRLALARLDYQHTSSWPAGEATDTLVRFPIPSSVPAGAYELRLIVYNAETLVPTVEIGVWEPELVLAQVRLADPP